MSQTKVLLMSCLLLIGALAVQAQNTAGVEKAIATMEQQWADAAKASNADVVAPMLAESFVELGSDGAMSDKSQALALIKGSRWEIAEIGDVKVTTSGNTAIATGTWRGKGTSNGQPVDTHERWLDTWVKMPGGKWQCVASASAPMKM